MKWKKVPPELYELLNRSLESFDCQERKMFGCPAYFVNNNMFTGAFQDSIFLRLSEEDRNKLSESYDEAEPFEPMQGRVMREYMVVPETIYNDSEEFYSWLKLSYDYASKIPSKKKKSKPRKKE